MARLLVTNDDGIHGPGMHALARSLSDDGHDVVVVAPDYDASGTSASLGRVNLREDLPVQRAELPGAPGVEAWALPGPPAMCVLAAVLGGFGDEPYDAVVSGINAGANTGRAILHSGTVGAALTAQNFGYRGLAVSLAEHEDDDYEWATAARLAAEVTRRLLEAPPRSALNLNVPALPDGITPPLRWARLASFGTVRSSMSGAEEGALQFELVAVDQELRADTDTAMIREGIATLTALGGVAEAWAVPPIGPADPADAPDGGVEGPTGGLSVAAHPVPGDELSPAHLFPDPEIAEHLHPRRFD
ncbi:MAG: 5'/3'-nucleotidase SurE [Acidimicrobiales bacterium]|jgi:5'-nucleotidase|nr:5'/3'-nucleotidase SurE [Acidimicrobiales bacterium]